MYVISPLGAESMILTVSVFFFNDTATTEIYTLSLHDALPISGHDVGMMLQYREHDPVAGLEEGPAPALRDEVDPLGGAAEDRKSTRLNSSHANISYAGFCLKKKKGPANTACTRLQSMFWTFSR